MADPAAVQVLISLESAFVTLLPFMDAGSEDCNLLRAPEPSSNLQDKGSACEPNLQFGQCSNYCN